VEADDNFFDLGGDSLLAAQVVSRLRSSLPMYLGVGAIFEAPTINGLVDLVLAAPRSAFAYHATDAEGSSLSSLSSAQERLWFVHQVAPDSAAYNIPSAFRIRGHLDTAALEESFTQILERHESLRTTFADKDGMSVQIVGPPVAFHLILEDLSDLPSALRETEVRRLVTEESLKLFDLSKDIMLRAKLFRLSAQEHVLVITTHHIASDGWSMGLIFHELQELYVSFVQDRAPTLPDLPIQYTDFSQWEKTQLQGGVFDYHGAYWTSHLKDAPDTLELPANDISDARKGEEGCRESYIIPNDLAGRLVELSNKERSTLFITLLAAFKALLYRYTRQNDLVVGVPAADRNLPETEHLIGFFVNVLALRTRLSGAMTLRELIREVREVAVGAYEHQEFPFMRLIEELQPTRTVGRNPFVQVVFALHNTPRSPYDLEIPGLDVSGFEIKDGVFDFDLIFNAIQSEDHLRLLIEYNRHLYTHETIRRMVDHFKTVLEAMVSDPDQSLDNFPLLTPSEYRQVVYEWNDTTTQYPKDLSVDRLFEEQALRTPDAPAVRFEEKQLSYEELDLLSDNMAHHLKRLGAEAGSSVGLYLPRSAEMIAAMLGALKIGAAYLPLDPSYPQERLAFMLKDSDVKVIVTTGALRESLPATYAEYLCVDHDEMKSPPGGIEKQSGVSDGDSLAYIMYTSGSTGTPKAIGIPHRGIVRLALNTNYLEVAPSDVVAQISNASFDAATFEIWDPLLNGACISVIPTTTVLSPRLLAQTLQEKNITILWLTAGLFDRLAVEVPWVFKSLRCIMFGGDVINTDALRMVLSAGPPEILLNMYGPTESTTFTTWYQVRDLPEGAKSVPIGRPIANTQVYILDDSLQPVPIGVPGELYIGGDGLAVGYANMPELTRETFVSNPFADAPGDRLYKTGDIAKYLPDGNIEFLGRGDDQVKIRGFRIQLGEIELVLQQHAAIERAVVLVEGHEEAEMQGSRASDKRLVAYLVLTEISDLSDTELREFLRTKLPDYMVPSEFCVLDEVPLTPHGKLDRETLRGMSRQQLVSSDRYTLPGTRVEKILADIWQEVLHMDQVHAQDKFFDLGGHSLLAMTVPSKIEKATGVRVSPVDIMMQTLGQLATVVEGQMQDERPEGSNNPFHWLFNRLMRRKGRGK
jgi:amino acid adenylation domain-containing protein